jgi:hypothetical protein
LLVRLLFWLALGFAIAAGVVVALGALDRFVLGD